MTEWTEEHNAEFNPTERERIDIILNKKEK